MSSTHPSSTSNWEPPSPEHLQRMLPQYEITDVLGRGGMGAVYKGRQTNLDREVAIKVLPETFTKGDDELNFAARFKQEARAMAKLDHPAIISVYDFGETPDGQIYFIMEFIDGMDIHQYLHHHGGKLPQEQALSITAHVLDALDYAHSHGIVHRDIKPANILLNRDGRVKIADFGLAKKLEESGGDSAPALTMTNVAVGTPDFVAPEALDSSQKPDHRADLYAVGVMLYQMLTGKLPRGQFKSPSALDSTIDPRLDEIVSKALQPHPDDRYSSAAMVRADLDVIFSRPFAKVEPGEESDVVAAVVPVTTTVKEGQAGKTAHRYAPASPPKSKLPLLIGLGVGACALVGLIWMATSGKKEKPSPAASVAPAAVSPTKLAETPPSSPGPKGTVAASAAPSEKTDASISPKPATAEKPDPVVATFPPGQWVKVFTKVEDLPEEMRDGGNKRSAAFEDGWITPSRPGVQVNLPLPASLATNYAVRARFRGHGTNGILVRPQSTSLTNGVYQLRAYERSLICHRRDQDADHLIANTPISQIGQDGEYVMEFGVVGATLVGRHNSTLAFVGNDSRYTAGPATIYVKDMPVRDIEVINLDGIPEVEALRLLGVDGQGKDLRAPQSDTAAPSPAATVTGAPPTSSPPAPRAGDAPTPGQWVQVNYEDLQEGARSNLKLEDGWMSPVSKPFSIVFPSTVSFSTNQGIRVRCKLSPVSPLIPEFKLRSSKSDSLALSRSFNTLTDKISHSGSVSAVLATGQFEWVGQPSEVIVEFAAVNERVFARFDGKLTLVAMDERAGQGTVAIWNAMGPFRDIEVINLDGLSESEALRILGVDEEGNDLRTLSLQKANQEAEAEKKAEAMAAIPELKTLHDQFLALEKTRVIDPFAAEVAKLNTGYLGGLDRAIAEEKNAGHLDGVLAIEQEKARIGSGESVPSEDDAATPGALKKLRDIYREAHAKLEATRAANRLALTDPLATRLRQIEADLTRQDRIEHAKIVREYREELETPTADPAPLSTTVAATPAAPSAPTPPAPASARRSSAPDPALSRAAAEHALSRGAEVVISPDETKSITVRPGTPLPKDDFELWEVNFPTNAGREVTDADVQAITPAGELRRLTIGSGNTVGVTSLAPFRDSARLYEIVIHHYGALTAEDCEVLASLPSLRKISFMSSSAPIADLARIFSAPQLESVSFQERWKPEYGELLQRLPRLKSLATGGQKMAELLAHMVDMEQLEELSMSQSSLTAAGLEALHENLSKTLVVLQFGGVDDDSSDAFDVAIRRFPKLESVFARGTIREEILRKLPTLRNLRILNLLQAEMTPESLQAVSQCRNLTRLILGNGHITANDITALRRLGDLSDLTLYDNGIRIDPEAIAGFAKLDQLTKLELPESQVTEAQVETLRKEMPGCTISRVPAYP